MDGKLVLIDFMLFILHLFFTVIILFILTNLIHHQIAMSWEKNKMRKWHLRKLMWIKLVHHCHIVSIFVVWFAGSFFLVASYDVFLVKIILSTKCLSFHWDRLPYNDGWIILIRLHCCLASRHHELDSLWASTEEEESSPIVCHSIVGNRSLDVRSSLTLL